MLLATELRAALTYWQIDDESKIYPAPFADNRIAAVIWDTKVDHSTWFGSNTEFIFGIEIMPVTPITELLLRPSWVESARDKWSTAIAEAGDQWRAFLIMAEGVLDPEAAWTKAASLAVYDAGNSKTNTLYWLATRGDARSLDQSLRSIAKPLENQPAKRVQAPNQDSEPSASSQPNAKAVDEGSGTKQQTAEATSLSDVATVLAQPASTYLNTVLAAAVVCTLISAAVMLRLRGATQSAASELRQSSIIPTAEEPKRGNVGSGVCAYELMGNDTTGVGEP